MPDLICETMVDARPATIFPFLSDPTKHLLWMGTERRARSRPGGIYRVLVRREPPVRR